MLRPLALSLLVATAAVLAASDGGEVGGLAGEASAAGPARLAPLPPAVEVDDAPHAFAAHRGDATGRPVLFDPCRPVPFAVRRAGELPGADALLDEAVAEIARASGLALVRLPDVIDALPDDDELARRRPDGTFPPAVVAWSTPAEREELEGPTVALGGGTTWAPDGRPGEERLVSGLVVLDAHDLAVLRDGPDGDARLRAALLHELAHLVGLGHVDDATQLLHHSATGTTLGTGDLRGLRAAGEGQCFQDW